MNQGKRHKKKVDKKNEMDTASDGTDGSDGMVDKSVDKLVTTVGGVANMAGDLTNFAGDMSLNAVGG